MKRLFTGVMMSATLAACAPAPMLVAAAPPAAPQAAPAPPADPGPRGADLALQATDQPGARKGGSWIGAAGESDFILAGTSESILGVWVDVPSGAGRARAQADVALVIDTSGSMAGPKIENARAAAAELVNKLADGDIVSISDFDDSARVDVPPTVLDGQSRAGILAVIARLRPQGGTNMFDGLRLAERLAFQGPPSHTVRRVVMISDGMANVGPSSPEVLGQLAASGADGGVQVSAIGVGIDYDERTLDALAVRSSGRLYHLGEPREMTAILDREVALLQSTAATGAFVEVVPASGVDILGADGVRVDRQADGSVHVPLGTMFGGQHREMALRVRVRAEDGGEGGRALASVRLHFRDPADSGLARVQEVVARYQVTRDHARVEASLNAKTRTILATQQAAQITVAAAQQVNDGHYEDADRQLAAAETKLHEAARRARTEDDKQRVMASASHIARARAAVHADAAMPAPPMAAAKRARALDVNAAGMTAAGF